MNGINRIESVYRPKKGIVLLRKAGSLIYRPAMVRRTSRRASLFFREGLAKN